MNNNIYSESNRFIPNKHNIICAFFKLVFFGLYDKYSLRIEAEKHSILNSPYVLLFL